MAPGSSELRTEQYYYDGVRRLQEDVTTPNGQGGSTTETDRQYLYGPEYVDEFVAQIDKGDAQHPDGHVFYTLQDANYNVVALVGLVGGTWQIVEQYTYEPYGAVVAVDDLVPGSHPVNRVGHQGLFYEHLDAGDGLTVGAIGLYYNRNRWYSPGLGKFTSRDPRATGQPVTTALPTKGESFWIVSDGFDPEGHYRDGTNVYVRCEANPLASLDPAGLEEHHLYPLHLGGASDGPGVDLSHDEQTAFHGYLREQGFPPGDKGRANWAALNDVERRGHLATAATMAGLDPSDPVFQAALDEAMEAATHGVKQDRKAVRAVYRIKRAPGGMAQKVVTKVSKGRLSEVGAKGKALAVVGGVLVAAQMADALRIDNPYVRDLAGITIKAKRSGQMSIMDEVTALDDLYQLTGDAFAASWAWTYWRESTD